MWQFQQIGESPSQFGANTPKAPIEITKDAAKLWSDIVNSSLADYSRYFVQLGLTV